jgi:hypothetical protein
MAKALVAHVSDLAAAMEAADAERAARDAVPKRTTGEVVYEQSLLSVMDGAAVEARELKRRLLAGEVMSMHTPTVGASTAPGLTSALRTSAQAQEEDRNSGDHGRRIMFTESTHMALPQREGPSRLPSQSWAAIPAVVGREHSVTIAAAHTVEESSPSARGRGILGKIQKQESKQAARIGVSLSRSHSLAGEHAVEGSKGSRSISRNTSYAARHAVTESPRAHADPDY